jgi:hypothetical protein
MYVLTQQPKGQLYYKRDQRWNKSSTCAKTWTHQDSLDDDDEDNSINNTTTTTTTTTNNNNNNNNNNNSNTKSYLSGTNNIVAGRCYTTNGFLPMSSTVTNTENYPITRNS